MIRYMIETYTCQYMADQKQKFECANSCLRYAWYFMLDIFSQRHIEHSGKNLPLSIRCMDKSLNVSFVQL